MTNETIGKLCVSRHGAIAIIFGKNMIKIRNKEMTVYPDNDKIVIFISDLGDDIQIGILRNKLIRNIMLQALKQELNEYTCANAEIATYKELIDTLNKLVELIDRAFGK